MEVVKAIRTLAGYTADQWGMVTTAQAHIVGINRVTLARLVSTGFLDHVRRGVYASTTAAEDPLRPQKAAWLQLNPAVPAWERQGLDPDGGVLSHGSAALVHEVGDLHADVIEFAVSRKRATKHSDIRLRRVDLPAEDVTRVDGLPVTTVERTIDDLLADHIDGGHAGDLIYQALRHGQVDPDSLADRIGRHNHRYGVKGRDGLALLEELLAQTGRRLIDATMTPTGFRRTTLPHEGMPSTALESVGSTLSPAMVEQLRAMVGALGTREIVANLPALKELQRRLPEIVRASAVLAEVQNSVARLVRDLPPQLRATTRRRHTNKSDSGETPVVAEDRDSPPDQAASSSSSCTPASEDSAE